MGLSVYTWGLTEARCIPDPTFSQHVIRRKVETLYWDGLAREVAVLLKSEFWCPCLCLCSC